MKLHSYFLFVVFFLFTGLTFSNENSEGEKVEQDMYVIVEGSTDAVLLESEDNRADDELRVRVKGTGQTIGHVLLLEVKNRDKNNPGKIRVTPSLIPGKGKTQAYFITDRIEREVPPGGEITISLEGVCIDPHKPPLGSGDKGTDFGTWISVNPLPDDWEPDPNTGWEREPESPLLNPVTENDLGHVIDITSHPREAADLIGVYIGQIIDTYDQLARANNISSPLIDSPLEERHSIIQHAVWSVIAPLGGEKYDSKDLEKRIFDQLPGSGADLSNEEREEVYSGIDYFWNTVTLVGVEAKVISTGSSSPGSSVFFPDISDRDEKENK